MANHSVPVASLHYIMIMVTTLSKQYYVKKKDELTLFFRSASRIYFRSSFFPNENSIKLLHLAKRT